MASPNREELYRMALNAAKSGQRKPAKVMLQQLLSQDEKHIRAMMLMAKISGKKERVKWLKRVLEINPDYDDAIEQLDKLDHGDAAKRNQQLLKFGLGTGAAVILVVAFLMIISAASVPI